MKKILFKFNRSISKLIFPFLAKLFISMRVNRRAINYLSLKSFEANNSYDFRKIIENLLQKKKLIAIDIGAQGGFNSDHFLPNRYNSFFDPILVEPIVEEANKLRINNKHVITNALWSSKEKKKINILGNRLGSSSMYEPDPSFFDIHNIKKKDYKNFDVTKKIEVQCETLSDSLKNIDIQKLDYLKIDTQGAELEILKGIGSYKPLIIKIETHLHSMYKNVPNWNELLDYLYKLDYIIIDWKSIGSHATRVPAEMDMIFIPNFNKEIGKKLIYDNEEKFISLMLIFGQINLLKIISQKNDFKSSSHIKDLNDFYFN